MRTVVGLALLGCALVAAPVRAGESELVDLDQLPTEVKEAFGRFPKGDELLDARKEMEGDNEFYIVGMKVHGRRIEYFISRDGGAVFLKEELFTLRELPEWLLGHIVILLLPGTIGGAFVRSVVQNGYGVRLSVLTEWLAAWIGAGAALGMLLCVLTAIVSRPRYSDPLALPLACVVWGAIAATVVELVGLVLQSIRGHRASSRRMLLGLSSLLIGLVLLSVAVSVLLNHRHNQHYKALILRRSANAPASDAPGRTP